MEAWAAVAAFGIAGTLLIAWSQRARVRSIRLPWIAIDLGPNRAGVPEQTRTRRCG